MPSETCSNCLYARGDEIEALRAEQLRLLACHRHPPMANSYVPSAVACWPLVDELDWCGEWRLNSDATG